MEKIPASSLINLLIENFPNFLPYWDSHVSYWGLNQGVTIQIIPFSDYVMDIIKTKNEHEIKKNFDYIEFLLCNGDDSIQNAITTSLLEFLLSKDPDEIQFNTFSKYLGNHTVNYCRTWDEFTGNKTTGIW